MTAGVVQAHTLDATLTCNDADPSVPVLTITTSDYEPTFTNTVEATIDGSEVLPITTFSTAYSGTFPGGDPFVAHTAVVKIHTNEDNEGTQGFTKEFDLSVDPCQTRASTPPSTPPSSKPSGGVEAATATPPATATVDPSAPTGTSSGFGFLMILFAVVALVVGFSPVGNRRKVNATTETRRR